MESIIVGFGAISYVLVIATVIGIPNAIIMRRLGYSWFWVVLGTVFPFPMAWFTALEMWPIEKRQLGTGNLRERVEARKGLHKP